MGVGAGEGKVLVGLTLVARKHTKAAGTDENKELHIAGKVAFRGKPFTGTEALTAASYKKMEFKTPTC